MDERKRQKIGDGALPPPHSAVPQSEQFDGDYNREETDKRFIQRCSPFGLLVFVSIKVTRQRSRLTLDGLRTSASAVFRYLPGVFWNLCGKPPSPGFGTASCPPPAATLSLESRPSWEVKALPCLCYLTRGHGVQSNQKGTAMAFNSTFGVCVFTSLFLECEMTRTFLKL